jgi:hypothetical protein
MHWQKGVDVWFCDISRHGFATGLFIWERSWDARLSSRLSGVSLRYVASRDSHWALKRKALVVATAGNSCGVRGAFGLLRSVIHSSSARQYRKPYYRELQDGVPFMRVPGYRLCVNAGYRLCVDNREQTRRFLTGGTVYAWPFRRSQERVGWRAEKDSGRSGLVSVRNQAAARQP